MGGDCHMKTKIALLMSLFLAWGAAYADEAKSDAKKSEKAKVHAKKKSEKKSDKKADKSAQKSDQNGFQKTESSIGNCADRNKLWVRSHKKDEKK